MRTSITNNSKKSHFSMWAAMPNPIAARPRKPICFSEADLAVKLARPVAPCCTILHWQSTFSQTWIAILQWGQPDIYHANCQLKKPSCDDLWENSQQILGGKPWAVTSLRCRNWNNSNPYFMWFLKMDKPNSKASMPIWLDFGAS